MNNGLPELVELIPKFGGEVASYEGKTYFWPENLQEVMDWWLQDNTDELARIGFRVYELKEFDARGAFIVVPFKCSLNQHELMKLSEQSK